MPSEEKVMARGDEYAKRLLTRSRTPDKNYSNRRRRLSIMEAINKNATTSTANIQYSGNPFKKEFLNEMNVSTNTDRDETSKYEDSLDVSSQAYSVEPRNRESTNSNFNSNEREKFNNGEMEYQGYSKPDMKNMMRPSIGERFGLLTPGELRKQRILNDKYDKEFEQCNAELLRQGPDEFFGARVLEIIEPVKVECQRKGDVTSQNQQQLDMLHDVKDSLEKVRLLNLNDESAASLDSEDVRDLDREIDRLQLECDEGVYEDVHQVKSAGGVVKEDKDGVETFNQETRKGSVQVDTASMETLDICNAHECAQDQTYSIVGPGPSIQEDSRLSTTYHGERRMTKNESFLKRSKSYLLKNLRTPILRRRKSGKTSKMSSPQAEDPCTLLNFEIDQPQTEFQKQMYQMQSNEALDLNDTVSSEVGKFLQTAWKCRHNSTMISLEHSMQHKSNTFSHSKEDKSKKVKRAPTMESRKHGGTLNRTLSICKTLTQKIRQRFRRPDEIETKEEAPSPTVQEYILKNLKPEVRQQVEQLENKIAVQNIIIHQTSKGAQFCDSREEFRASTERVEMERILLSANLNKIEILKEINRLMSSPVEQDDTVLGEVTLKKIKLQLREDMLKRQNDTIQEWFILVISHSTTVWVSDAVILPISCPQLIFPGKLTLQNLHPDFHIKVRVYSLKLQQLEVYNHDQKYRIRSYSFSGNRPPRMSSTPTPKPNRRRFTISPTVHKIKYNGVRESLFTLCGAVDLMLYDLKLLPPWRLRELQPQSMLTGEIHLDFRCKLKMTGKHMGFLTYCHGSELMSWNRYFCVLDGQRLLFWNHPEELRPPVYLIELTNCVSSSVYNIDPELCPKPRTLLIETSNRRCTIDKDVFLQIVQKRSSRPTLRHYLSFDTYAEMTEWQTKINNVISSLRDWNIIRSTTLPVSSLPV